TSYYGDLAGSGLAHVAFTWTFTTQPVFDDMRVLRDGLHGRGPFARLAREFAPDARAFRSVGFAIDEEDEPVGEVEADPKCAPYRGTPFIVRVDEARDTFRGLIQAAIGFDGEPLRRLEESLDNVDHFAIGSF